MYHISTPLASVLIALFRKSKFFIVVIMLLTLVGQATAIAAIPCQMTSVPSKMEQAGQQSVIDHSAHMMSMSSNSPESDSVDNLLNCCEPGSNCSMGSCVSMLIEPSENNLATKISIQKIIVIQLLAISHFPSSLYRPPIIS